MTTLTFTVSGTWNAAATSVDCQCTGSGGGGGGGLHNSHSGGGGGGGEYAEETTLAVTSGSNYTYTIGTAGSSTNTSFPGDAATVTAHYGSNASGSGAGPGGTGSSNSVHFDGTSGSGGTLGTGNHNGGAGGSGAGPGGTGTGGAGGAGGAPSGAGSPGTAPGGGGGGGGRNSTTNPGGGAGSAGQIVLIYEAAQSGTSALSGEGTISAFGGPLLAASLTGTGTVTAARAGAAYASLAGTGMLTAVSQQKAPASLSGAGSISAYGAAPAPAVVNQWANNYGQGTTFTSITSALQSCVVPLNPGYSVGTGSGTPSEGNWLFCIVSWTQDPAIAEVHTGVGDDGHSWWREYPASPASGITRTSIAYTPNITSFVQNVYVAPDMEVAAINVLVVEVSGLGPWDTVTGTNSAYAAASESVSLSLGAPAQHCFFIGGTGGDNVSSGQAFLPSGWTGLVTQTQTNGSDHLADNILTAAFLASSGSAQSVSGTSSANENMSGFLLGVYVIGLSPIPANQNPNWPYMVFEAGFGAGFNTPDSEITWTDLSSRLWSWEETTGIQYQLGQLQSTNLTMNLDNLDGYLSPLNTASPYYPNCVPGTPVRLRAALGTLGGNIINRWYVIQRNAAQWDEEIDEVFRRYCPVSGTDLWAALSSTPPSFYRSEVYEDTPYAWWPCDDQPGNSGVLPTQLLNAAQGNTNVLNIQVSPSGAIFQQVYNAEGAAAGGFSPGSAGASVPPGMATYAVGADQGWMFGDPLGSPSSIDTGNPVSATPGSAAWQTGGQTGTTGSHGWYLICNDSSFPPLSAGITVETWFNINFYKTSTGFQTSDIGTGNFAPALQQPYNCPLTILELATGSGPTAVLQLDTSGHLNLIIAGSSYVIYSSSDLRSESWHMVTMTLTTSGWTVWLDGGVNAEVSGSASVSSSWEYLIVNADFGAGGGNSPSGIVHGGNASYAHIAVYPYLLPYYRILDHYWAAVTAFGQLPAPSGIQVEWLLGIGASESGMSPGGDYTPDGNNNGSYATQNGVGMSARVAALAPGVTSGPSAWSVGSTEGLTNDTGTGVGTPWVGWTGLAPQFEVYTSASPGTEEGAALVNGSGNAFVSGYGGSATSDGVCAMGPGSGSPPGTTSAIGDSVGERIERLMRGGRCASPNRCIDPAPLLVQAPGAASSGTQVGAMIQQVTQSDSGLLFVDNLNHLTYWQRPHLASQYSTPVWNAGPTTAGGRIPYYKEIKWVTDPQRIYNVVTVDPVSPTGAALPLITPGNASAVKQSQIRYGAQPLQIASWLQDTSEMQSQADWLFSVYGTPQRHAEQVKIEASAYPGAWELVMGINMGDVVQLEDWIIGGGGNVYTYRVTELERHISQGFGSQANTTASVTLILDYEPTSYWS